MKLLKPLDSVTAPNGAVIQRALFHCEYCGADVERLRHNGLKQKSCGCIRTPHGGSGTALYQVWAVIKHRCQRGPEYAQWDLYGGRGISLCAEWETFTPFQAWALTSGYQEGLMIDRENNDGNYEPSNCRWVTPKKSAENRRTTKLSPEKVTEIRRLCASGIMQKDVAAQFGVARNHVSMIVNRKKW